MQQKISPNRCIFQIIIKCQDQVPTSVTTSASKHLVLFEGTAESMNETSRYNMFKGQIFLTITRRSVEKVGKSSFVSTQVLRQWHLSDCPRYQIASITFQFSSKLAKHLAFTERFSTQWSIKVSTVQFLKHLRFFSAFYPPIWNNNQGHLKHFGLAAL